MGSGSTWVKCQMAMEQIVSQVLERRATWAWKNEGRRRREDVGAGC